MATHVYKETANLLQDAPCRLDHLPCLHSCVVCTQVGRWLPCVGEKTEGAPQNMAMKQRSPTEPPGEEAMPLFLPSSERTWRVVWGPLSVSGMVSCNHPEHCPWETIEASP